MARTRILNFVLSYNHAILLHSNPSMCLAFHSLIYKLKETDLIIENQLGTTFFLENQI
jgi:hypothetical protein